MGDRVKLELVFDNDPIDLVGVVRRFDGWRLAVMFLTPETGTADDQHAALVQLLESLKSLGLTDPADR